MAYLNAKQTNDYLALDLGAESGRGLLGKFDFDQGALTLEEVHRFPNEPVRMLDTLHWDVLRLYHEMKLAIRKASQVSETLDGLGVDTWGVDFALIGRGGTLLGNPVHYRDGRTDGMLDQAFQRIARERIYEITGLQFLPINSAYQLLAMRLANSPILEAAETLLMMPDLFHWLLTGRRASEMTDASTSQLLDPRAGAWSPELCEAFELPRSIFPELIPPGTVVETLRKSVIDELGLSLGGRELPVIATGTHDTASAVAAVPAVGKTPGALPDWCYISSGTWSLLGVEVARPVINAETLKANFTNEGGVAGTTRLLKNIMGLWLVQECRRTWAREGRAWSYEELVVDASASRPFGSLVDPDDPTFLAPGDMPARIASYCKKTGQSVPNSAGAFVRCALESLALKYRWGIERLESILKTELKSIHIVGGGSRNALLCQFTADATGRPVYAGPVEATAAGNVLLQAIARGKLGSLAGARQVVAQSFPVTLYEPRDNASWAEANGRFQRLLGS